MTRSTHYPLPIEQQDPVGLTSKATTPIPNGRTCREDFDATTSEKGNQYASEATPQPRRVEGPSPVSRIPAKGSGGREGDYRQSEGDTRHLSPSRLAGSGRRGCGVQHGQPARCAGTTSAESVEGRLLGSQGVEIPHTIPHAYERMNAPQMRRDKREERSFRMMILTGLIVGLLAVCAAHVKLTSDMKANWERINE